MGRRQPTDVEPLLDEKVAALFWRAVQKGDANACWPWKQKRYPAGYGAFALPYADGERRNRNAHRVAWALANGRWPESRKLEVMHSCNMRACCNPAHLKLGTHQENQAQMTEQGRAASGFRHWTWQDGRAGRGGAKLTLAQVRTILRAIKKANGKQGVQAALARQFNVSAQTISMIARGLYWKGGAKAKPRLTDAQVMAIRKAYAASQRDGMQQELAAKYGVSASAISAIVNRRTHRGI